MVSAETVPYPRRSGACRLRADPFARYGLGATQHTAGGFMKRASLWIAAVIAVAAMALPGTAGAVTGCPNTGRGESGPYKIEFAVGRSAIAPANTKTLNEVAGLAKSRYLKVCLLGRADKQGNQKSNYDLSVRRAETVAAALRRRGVNPKSIIVVGAGEAYGDWLNILNQSQADRAVEIILSR
jgi:outer membrane protein OmpA-like peptidoglycan-associated protein